MIAACLAEKKKGILFGSSRNEGFETHTNLDDVPDGLRPLLAVDG